MLNALSLGRIKTFWQIGGDKNRKAIRLLYLSGIALPEKVRKPYVYAFLMKKKKKMVRGKTESCRRFFFVETLILVKTFLRIQEGYTCNLIQLIPFEVPLS